MKKVVCSGLALATIVTAAIVAMPRVDAAQRDRVIPPPGSVPFLPLEGPGSSIGVTVRDQSPSDAAGVLIDNIQDGTPATKAGLQKGDVVVEFDGERTRSARQFTRLVRETPPGRSVRMTVLRDGSKRTLDITPESRDSRMLQQFPGIAGNALRVLPRDFNFNFDRAFPFAEGFYGSPRRLGVMVSPLSDQLATYFGVKEGVLVSEVVENTPAASAGLKAGDVITAVNGRPVMSTADVTREVNDTDQGAALELRVMRDRKELTLKVSMPQRRPVTAGTLPI
jgi:serine protease Do